MKRVPFIIAAVAAISTAHAVFATSFEAPEYTAGMILTGQGAPPAWYIPVAGSVDWNCDTYAGNPPGFPVNVAGGAQFVWGQCAGVQTSFARAQHDHDFSTANVWTSANYIAVKYIGTLPT